MIDIMNRQLERIIRYTISSFVRSIYKFFEQQQRRDSIAMPRDQVHVVLLRLFHQCQPLCDVIKTGLTNWSEIALFFITLSHLDCHPTMQTTELEKSMRISG